MFLPAVPRLVPLIAVVALAFPLRMAAAQEPRPPDPDVVMTSGEGVVKVTPDRAFVVITAESRARTPGEAQARNAAAMTAVRERLKAASLAADAVRTLAVDLQPEFDYTPGKQTLRGYVARNSIEVRVDEVTGLGEVIDAAVGSGATAVSDVRFDVKDRKAAERKALEQAVADARARADALASAAGRAVDRIVRIDDAGAGEQPPPRPLYGMRAEAAMAAPTTPVTPGEVEVRARVTLTARLR